jgi:hypothetical protein
MADSISAGLLGGPVGGTKEDVPPNTDEIGENRLVIAIDYGTTFTGIWTSISVPKNITDFDIGFSYAISRDGNVQLDKIKVFQDWTEANTNDYKVPSVIAYLENGIQEWGNISHSKAVGMIHTKLELDTQDTSDELDLLARVCKYTMRLGFVDNLLMLLPMN